MEQFTELNGQIRIDTIDEQNHLDSCQIDIGDGRFFIWDKKIIGNKRTHISLWGEINDFSNEKKLIDWIIKKTNHFHIRSGVIEILVDEKDKKFIMIYNGLTQKWDISNKSY